MRTWWRKEIFHSYFIHNEILSTFVIITESSEKKKTLLKPSWESTSSTYMPQYLLPHSLPALILVAWSDMNSVKWIICLYVSALSVFVEDIDFHKWTEPRACVLTSVATYESGHSKQTGDYWYIILLSEGREKHCVCVCVCVSIFN